MQAEQIIRRHYVFYGRVQGVGFRYHAQYAANQLRLAGWVHNCYDGSVEMELQGTLGQQEKVLEMLFNARFVSIDSMDCKEIPLEEESGFRVR